jgi:cytochrome P450
MSLKVDFNSQDFFRDPTAGLEKLRAAGPVVEVKLPIIGRVWADDHARDGLSCAERQPDVHLAPGRRRRCGAALADTSIFHVFAKNMLTADEPDHSRLRGIVDEAFRRRAVLDMKPRICAIAAELAGDLFAQGSPADLVTPFR